MTTIILYPWAPLPERPASPETSETWRTRLREAGCVWVVSLFDDGDVVELVCPDEWLSPEREAWIDAHAGELRAMAIRWARWRRDEEEEVDFVSEYEVE